jgi:hypothetical protein
MTTTYGNVRERERERERERDVGNGRDMLPA